jgi:DNA-binding NarL/FixJ family response regulator
MVVDNDPRQADMIKAALDQHEDFEITAIATTREAALRQVTTGPDVVILNPEVLKQHTLSRFLHSLQARSQASRVICVLKESPTEESAISDIKAGIRGILKIGDPPSIIAKAVRSVHEGEIWAERRILEKGIAKPMLLPETLQTNVPGLPPLTTREMEMLTLVLQGATNREIADRSSISERTVKTHLYRVYRKLRVKSRTKAIALLSHA